MPNTFVYDPGRPAVFQSVFGDHSGRTGSRTLTGEIVNPDKARPDGTLAPTPPPSGGDNSLGRFPLPSSIFDLPPRPLEGPREEGRPLKALWNTAQSPARWNDFFHAPIPPDDGEPQSVMSGGWQGCLLGATLGLVAAVVAGLIASLSAWLQKLPLAMLPMLDDRATREDFRIISLIAAITILDTGAAPADAGKWNSPLFWWVAGLTALAFSGNTAIKAAINRRRQRGLL